jgi:hypothetical protein
MKPEELFKIEDTEIPKVTEETVTTSDESLVEKKKIDVFNKDLTIEELMGFLKNNNILNDTKIVEKYYEEIVTNNKEKEIITEIIKQLDSEKETIVKQIEVEPNNPILLKKINDLEEKISNLNTEERIKEDNVKTIIKEISKVNIEKSEPEIKPETVIKEEPKIVETKTTTPEEMGINQTSEIKPEEMGINQTSEIKSEDIQKNEEGLISSEKQNQTSNIRVENEETTKINPLEEMKTVSTDEDKEFSKTIENDETMKELKKNNEMLREMSKNIDYNLELVLKAISENVKGSEVERPSESGEFERGHVENPQISQPKYIDQYRKSLRKYGGMESFMGYDIPFKGDNLGSYI